MAYESLDDILEQIADWCDVYGGCKSGLDDCHAKDPRCCKAAFVTALKGRILEAVRIDAALENAARKRSYDTCPNCGGPADNGHDRCYPPNPYHCTKCTKREKLYSERKVY